MPRINITGQEGKRKATWQDVQNMILENLFESTPREEFLLKQEIEVLIEEAKKYVCETDKRESN